ncbi:hypothetical protein P7L64_06315 [Tistrella bauzanensis]|uniref:hypothetical protein n=1 Tax=Tistrella bauzanensis TaxID=657419 RepID=UPI001669673B|nr:hypothetical protein [Tistrella bauzanensis]
MPADATITDASSADHTATADILTRELTALVARGGRTMAARVLRLDLSPIRLRLGNNWPERAERIHLATETTLRRFMGDGALVAPYGPDAFLVVAARLTPDAAALALRQAAADLTRFVFGNDIDAALPQIDRLLGTGPSGILFERIDDEPAPDPAMTIAAGQQRQQRATTAWQTAPARRHAAAAAGAALPPISPAAPEHGRLPVFDTFNMPDLPDIQPVVRYLPIATLKTMTIAAGAVMLEHKDILGTQRNHQLLGDDPEPALLAEFDNRVLDRAARDVALRLHHGLISLVVSSVHFNLLASGSRRAQYVGHLHRLPASVRRALVINLVDCPGDVSPALLAEMIAGLKSGARGVVVNLPIGNVAGPTGGVTTIANLQPFADSGVMGLCHLFDTRMPEAPLAALAARIQRARLSLMLTALREPEQLDIARRLNAQTVTGRIIGRGDPEPPIIGTPVTPDSRRRATTPQPANS